MLYTQLQQHDILLRRTSQLLQQHLPPKHEIVLYCRISSVQLQIYKQLVKWFKGMVSNGNSDNNDATALRSTFDAYTLSSMLFDHPYVLRRCVNKTAHS